jgi:formylglycine-generating enzyme required for sulfatase activity/dienelactone hydrolase
MRARQRSGGIGAVDGRVDMRVGAASALCRRRGLMAWLVGLLMAASSSGALADWPTCINEGNVDRRIAACTKVIQNGPSSGRMSAYSTRAILHLAKGELDLAEEDLRNVLALPAKTDAERKLHEFAGSALPRIAVSRREPAALKNPASDPRLNETIVRLPLSVKLPSGATHKGEFVLTTMRPHGAGPFPAVIVSHGYDGLLRTEMGRNRMLGPELVRRGFAVLAPTRIGHGVSAIPEDPERARGRCETEDFRPAVTAGVAHIQATIAFAAAQSWIDKENLILLGGSAGGIYSLVAAGSRPKGVRAVVDFAGGEGGRFAHPGKPCNPAGVAGILATAGKGNPTPTLWLYSDNDKLFGPSIPRQWHAAYVKAGGKAEFHMLPPLGDDGHQIIVLGREYWMPLLDGFLASNGLAQSKAAPPVSPPAAKQPQTAAVITPTSCDGIEITVGQNERRCFKPGAGKTEHFKDCSTCPEMVVVPAGSFTMGSPANEPQRFDDEVQVRVSIAAPFAVGRFAVTFDDWAACVADSGCNGYKPDDLGWGGCPVVNVNWDDAKAYAAWLSRKTGKAYRLLSEAEREYVTRAGTTTPFWWGSSITPNWANYNGSAEPYDGGGSKGEYRKRTVLVGSFDPNPWGLYNVHGNVWEWTEDCWNDSNTDNPGDGSARMTGDCTRRVARGGSWSHFPEDLRSANRVGYGADGRFSHQGFRVARTLNP